MYGTEPVWVLVDMYSVQIIQHLSCREAPIQELVKVLKIPKSSCYRRMELMRAVNLVRPVGKRTSECGRKVTYYTSDIKEVLLRFTEDGPTINIEFKKGTGEQLTRCYE